MRFLFFHQKITIIQLPVIGSRIFNFFRISGYFSSENYRENYFRIILVIIFAAMALRRLHEEGRELRRATDFHAEFAPEGCRMDLHMLWVLLARKGMHPAERMNRALQSVHGHRTKSALGLNARTRTGQENRFEKGARRPQFCSTSSTMKVYDKPGKSATSTH